MAGGGFSLPKGGTSLGAAPVTTFFGAVPDKYNMLLPLYYFDNGSTQGHVLVSVKNAATNINQWVPWDSNWGGGGGSNITASIGSATTAPDGTNTAYHVTENSSTGYHIMTAGIKGDLQVPMRRRLAVFAKAAERTRLFMMLGNYINLSGVGNRNEGGVYCVFDLAGGQVGVGPTVVSGGGANYNYTALGAEIKSFGNGWYLCFIDVSLASNANPPFQNGLVVQAWVGPDSGSGTGAASFKYAGNGTSGIYIWNTNLLHPRAWGMGNTVFFDDFPNLNSVDINNTKAAGFKWYVAGNTWPENDDPSWQTPIPPGTLTVTSSVLKVPDSTSIGIGGSGIAPNVMTAAYTSGTSYVGQAWVPPFIFEWNGRFAQGANGDELAWWSLPIELMMTSQTAHLEGQFYHEMDIVDSGVAGAQYSPIFGYLTNAGSPIASPAPRDDQLFPWAGYVQWTPEFVFSSGQTILWQGIFYTSTINNNVGNQPDLNPSDWTAGGSPSNPTATGANFDANNIWTFMRIPDRSMYPPYDDTGQIALWFNGIPTLATDFSEPQEIVYGSNNINPLGSDKTRQCTQTGDGFHYFVILGSGNLRPIYADSVKVIQ